MSIASNRQENPIDISCHRYKWTEICDRHISESLLHMCDKVKIKAGDNNGKISINKAD